MPLLFIHARDAKFQSCDDGADYDQPEDALALGVKGAVALVTDAIGQGDRSAAVEISVEQEDGTQLLRSIVTLCVLPLIPTVPPTHPDGGIRTDLGSRPAYVDPHGPGG